jgi:hypothetical protein
MIFPRASAIIPQPFASRYYGLRREHSPTEILITAICLDEERGALLLSRR